MSHQEQLYQWTETTREYLPDLSKAEALVLSLWSLGMLLARSCATPQIALLWSEALGMSFNTCRQRLREFYLEAAKKRGQKRHQLAVTLCFAPLLKWVLAYWHGEQLALALDATTLGDRFRVLVISVLFGRCAIPVAWKVLPAQEKGAWREHWLTMLDLLGPAVPKTMRTLVLCDRGLYAKWLFAKIVQWGWHPFLRVNVGGTFRPVGQKTYRKLGHVCPVGQTWAGRGTAFQGQACLECTLLACWQAGCKDPWLILTDLAPQEAQACWYGYRAWIEQGFKVLKSSGWQWQDTRMSDPGRVERLWLAMAIATLGALALGEAHEEPVSPVRAFRRGQVRLLVRLLEGERLVLADLIPPDWNVTPPKPREIIHPQKVKPPLAREYLPQ